MSEQLQNPARKTCPVKPLRESRYRVKIVHLFIKKGKLLRLSTRESLCGDMARNQIASAILSSSGCTFSWGMSHTVVASEESGRVSVHLINTLAHVTLPSGAHSMMKQVGLFKETISGRNQMIIGTQSRDLMNIFLSWSTWALW